MGKPYDNLTPKQKVLFDAASNLLGSATGPEEWYKIEEKKPSEEGEDPQQTKGRALSISDSPSS